MAQSPQEEQEKRSNSKNDFLGKPSKSQQNFPTRPPFKEERGKVGSNNAQVVVFGWKIVPEEIIKFSLLLSDIRSSADSSDSSSDLL